MEIKKEKKNNLLRVYGSSVLITVLLGLISWILTPSLGSTSLFVLYFFGVVISACYGGQRSGILTVILTAGVADYFALPPFHRWNTSSSSALFQFAVFFL